MDTASQTVTAQAVTAQLVASIHQPQRASLRECLDRWRRLDPSARASAYLVLEGPEPRLRRTLNAAAIEALAHGR